MSATKIVPLEKLYRDAIDKLPLFTDISCSQEGEDILLKRLLKNKYTQRGIYVDLGALHPVRFSNTAHYYMRGWHGINVEPNPDVIDLFNEIRPRDTNLSFAIGEDGEATYYKFREPAFNTFDLSQVEFAKTKTELIQSITVLKKKLSKVLDKHLDCEDELVFFNVDVEGNELEVLKTNDWSKYRPLLLLVEALSEEKYFELKGFLERYDYHFVARTKNTYFFAEAIFKREFVD